MGSPAGPALLGEYEEVPASMFEDVNSSEPLPDALGADSVELADWKAALRADFDRWLAALDRIPEEDDDEADADDPPDLFSFHQQLALANVEARKANRRTAEAFSQWGETLARFESQLGPLRESAAQLTAA